MIRKSSKYVHEGKYAAEVPVDLIEDDTAWSPYLSPDDARKLNTVRLALRRGDIAEAAKHGRVFELTPVAAKCESNAVAEIGHKLEVIKTADWMIDLGPEGGDGGGEIVAVGPPETILKQKRSYTGRLLKPVLARKPAAKKGIQAAE
jgi:hypothetical protein